jgi:lactate permease
MIFTQTYDPFDSAVLSTLVAALPVVLLLGLLATGRVSAPLAALVGLLAAFFAGVFAFAPPEIAQPESGGRLGWALTIAAAAGDGAAYGLFPIGWIVLSALFLYALTVETGQFEIVKHSVLALSEDRRIQALLIAFSFGAFIEGAAGFGTPVAISAALLIGAGFRPLYAAGLALLANTSPVAFGALGTPILMLHQVTGLSEITLSAMAGRQLPIFSLIVPVWLVWAMAGWRATLEIWPALLVCGGSFALVQFLTANLHGPWLVDVVAGLVSLASLAVFLRFHQPRKIWRFPEEKDGSSSVGGAGGSPAPGEDAGEPPAPRYSRGQIVSAWVPWLLLTVLVFVWGLPQFKIALKPTVVQVPVPGLHQRIARERPVVESRQVESAVYDLNLLTATGTGIFLAAVLSACWLQVGPVRFVRIFGVTTWRMRWPLFTIACMLAIAFTTRYTGMDATLGLAFTRTGAIYPLFAALLGWLGVALTGSDTSANALFGSLQTITARRLVSEGVLPLTTNQAMILLATANSTGGVMGKMIDAQSIVVAAVATQQYGQEGAILRFVFRHSLIMAVLMGLLVLGQAYLWSWMIPVIPE